MRKPIITALAVLCMTTTAGAASMAHWANVRDICGNIIGQVYESEWVCVEGYDESSGRVWISTDAIRGTVAPVYLYGGSDYYYENPVYYPVDPGQIGYAEHEWTEPEPVYVEPEPEPEPVYTWVDVDISSQTVTVYSGDTALLTARCVTGNAGTNDTPTGTYYVLRKETDATLTGADYSTPVNYWMPFTDSGCGLHDAWWRYDFGPDAYCGNGSHGCVNLTSADAGQIYDMVDVGAEVRVHE